MRCDSRSSWRWRRRPARSRTRASSPGRVSDASGAVLPAVSVTATAIATGVTAHAITNSEGLYTIPALTVGSYRVGVELTGFKRAAQEAIDVHAQSRV